MQPSSFQEVLQRMIDQDPRYDREAYLFLREALDLTQKRSNAGPPPESRHVTGRELLEGLRKYALAQYGPMAKTVLNEWGIRNCDDFGELVFHMVDHGLLSKTDQDSRADFSGGYDFDEAFRKPFQPRSGEAAPAPARKGQH